MTERNFCPLLWVIRCYWLQTCFLRLSVNFHSRILWSHTLTLCNANKSSLELTEKWRPQRRTKKQKTFSFSCQIWLDMDAYFWPSSASGSCLPTMWQPVGVTFSVASWTPLTAMLQGPWINRPSSEPCWTCLQIVVLPCAFWQRWAHSTQTGFSFSSCLWPLVRNFAKRIWKFYVVYFIKRRGQVAHSVEISGFFYHSDFTWNQLWRI